MDWADQLERLRKHGQTIAKEEVDQAQLGQLMIELLDLWYCQCWPIIKISKTFLYLFSSSNHQKSAYINRWLITKSYEQVFIHTIVNNYYKCSLRIEWNPPLCATHKTINYMWPLWQTCSDLSICVCCHRQLSPFSKSSKQGLEGQLWFEECLHVRDKCKKFSLVHHLKSTCNKTTQLRY